MTTLLDAAKLDIATRDALPSSSFAVPGKRALPIHDKTHVEMAWKMVDRTEGLSSDEKAQARKRILNKAKELGIDTSDWEGMKASAEELTGLHLTGVTLSAKAHIDVEDSTHINKIPISGVLTKLDEPSDSALGGSNGMRVILPKAVAEKALHTLIDMPLDFSNKFDSHNKKQNFGAISAAKIEGNKVVVSGHLYGVSHPDEVEKIKKEQKDFGFSFEVSNVSAHEVQDPKTNEKFLVIDDCVFTGAAVLYKA